MFEFTNSVIGRMVDGEIPNYGYLGLQVRDLSDQQKSLHGGIQGVQIVDTDDRFAGVAGLNFSDVLTHFDGVPIDSVQKLEELSGRTFAGQAVSLSIKRGALDGSKRVKKFTHQVNLSKRRIQVPLDSYASKKPPSWRGLMVEYPTAIESYRSLSLLIDPEGCVVVTEVANPSNAWKAGIRPMMVIHAVNGLPVRTPSDFYSKTNLRPSSTVQLTVVDSATLERKQIVVESQ